MTTTPQITRKFGTFTGVFTPTLLTILGVIMYVRLPWVVGNAGLMGAWLLMALAMGITACTGLSLSSIATNTRIGSGGPYAIVQKSLGYEIGGSVGVPLYLTRPLGTAMYIFGFREGWLWAFPDHWPMLVDLSVFVVIFALVYVGADIAFRVQFGIMAVIVASIASILASPALSNSNIEVTWFGAYPGFPEDGFGGVSLWVVFALFFPATTGILAGANMSGDLKNPRKSIPAGTLWAIGVSTVVYFGLAYCAARMGTVSELTSNYNLFIDRAFWGPAVLAGLLGATFSSALAGCVGGPRILMAMGEHGILPKSEWLARIAENGEPRNAVLVTAILTFAALLMRDLNAIAPLLTMFFLITYTVINVVLLLESSMGLVSFRPSLTLPKIVPLFGTIGGVFTMFIINPTFGLVAVATVIAIYIYVLRLGIKSEGEDVRSSIFVSLAEWAAAKVTELDVANVRAWKPNLLVPIEDPAAIRGQFRFLLDICRPEGSVKLLALATDETEAELRPRIDRIVRSFRHQDVFATGSIVRSDNFQNGTISGLQALQSAFFRPNILFLTSPDDVRRHREFGDLIKEAKRTGVGVLLLAMHPKAQFGQSTATNVLIHSQAPDWNPEAAFGRSNLNLLLLLAYRLSRSWNAELNLLTGVDTEADKEAARHFLEELADLARLPKRTKQLVIVGRFPEVISKIPAADLNLVGMQSPPNFSFIQRLVSDGRASCLSVLDSGRESALA